MSKPPPLSGRRVAVTRAREQSPALASKLAAVGAEVIELPLIRISKDVSNDTLAEIMPGLGTYDWIAFTSANGVRFFFEEFFRLFDDLRSLGLLRIACVGEGTAEAIAALHLRVDCQPKVATAEALAEAMAADGSLDNAKVLAITGSMNRDTLVKKLEESRAIVDQLKVYRTDSNDLASDPAAADFRTRGADAILFASSSAVESFAKQAAALQRAPGSPRLLAGSIGPQTSEAMKRLGIPVDFEAKTPGLDALVEALVKKMGTRS